MSTAYWDLNGTDPNSGSSTPTGTWDALSTNWNPSADGTGIVAAWAPGQVAKFAAGDDANGTYVVTVNGMQDIGGMAFEEGTVTLADGNSAELRMVAPSLLSVASGLTATVAVAISDDGNSYDAYKTGDGALVLSGANTYTGGTNVMGGTLQLGAAGVIPDTSNVTVNGTASVLDLNGNNETIGGLALDNGAAVTTGAGTLTLGGDASYGGGAGATISGQLDLGAATRTVTVGDGTSADDLTISANISGTGVGLTKDGAGKLLLSGTNTYSGPTTLAAGTLEVTSTAALPGYASAGNVVFDGGTLLFVNGGGLTTGDVETIMANATKTSGVLAIDTSSGDLTQWAAFNFGGVGVTKLGGNTLVLDQANTYSDTVVSGGILNANATDSLGTGSVTVSGGTLNINAAQSYTGATSVTAGTLKLANVDAIANSSGLTLAGGALQLDTSINLKALTYATSVNTTISGHTLNFAPGGEIHHTVTTGTLTITSGITGSPNVRMASGSAANDLNFYPAAESQTLGVITAPYTDGSGDKGELRFGGTTTGNTVQSIGYLGSGMHYGYMYKEGSSTWTVNGDVAQGKIEVNAGTLIINGKFTSLYQGFSVPIKSGARLGGNLHYLETDARFGHFKVNSGGIVAPGNPSVDGGVGTITLEWGESRSETAYAYFYTGSIYEWQIGADDANGNPTTDTIHMERVTRNRTLVLQDFVLKILDAGGAPGGGDQLAVFTYDDGVVVDMSLFGNDSDNFNTDNLDSSWTIGTLSLVNGGVVDGIGTIYLTGLAKITSVAGDTNGDNVVDAADFMTVKQNFGQTIGGGASVGDFDETGTVDWADLNTLMANMGAGGPAPATAPEPATLGLLAIGALAVVRRRRK